jgi:predicted Zn-dependent protease
MARSRRTAIGRLALEELVSRYPAEPNVHYALGVYLQPEEPDRAAREFRRELDLDPDNHVAMLQLASMELRRGNIEEALEMSRRGFELAPELPAAHLMLGRCLVETGELERAVELLEAGAAMSPRSPDFAFALARAYRRAGRADEAARADERFQRLKQAREQSDGPEGGAS